jgi:hypothetical protein
MTAGRRRERMRAASSFHILRSAAREVEQNARERPDFAAVALVRRLPLSGPEVLDSYRRDSREPALVAVHLDGNRFDQSRLLRHQRV